MIQFSDQKMYFHSHVDTCLKYKKKVFYLFHFSSILIQFMSLCFICYTWERKLKLSFNMKNDSIKTERINFLTQFSQFILIYIRNERGGEAH